jgi:hypothetical protein
MANHPSESPVSPIQRDFQEYMQRGDDFFKIELLRPARAWYSKALELNIETDTVRQRIAECDRMLSFENKVVGLLSVVAAILLIALFVI